VAQDFEPEATHSCAEDEGSGSQLDLTSGNTEAEESGKNTDDSMKLEPEPEKTAKSDTSTTVKVIIKFDDINTCTILTLIQVKVKCKFLQELRMFIFFCF